MYICLLLRCCRFGEQVRRCKAGQGDAVFRDRVTCSTSNKTDCFAEHELLCLLAAPPAAAGAPQQRHEQPHDGQ